MQFRLLPLGSTSVMSFPLSTALVLTGLVAPLSVEGVKYTTNDVCIENNCVSPIFPALEEFHRLDKTPYTCMFLEKTQSGLQFCRPLVNYDFSLPADQPKASLHNLVRMQDNAALTQFYFHLAGLGMDAWDYRDPLKTDNICVQSVWRATCYTFFPRAEAGCTDGTNTTYKRPCKSVCENYISACGVECCDESVQCVFSHDHQISATEVVKTSGYVDHWGPSSLCTGAARRGASLSGAVVALFTVILAGTLPQMSLAASARWAPPVALLLVATGLQGCVSLSSVPLHRVGNWRGEKDYLREYQFLKNGEGQDKAILNSCALNSASQGQQCSGNGKCKIWDRRNTNSRLSFCVCNPGFADPECGTERKSQMEAFFISLFFGYLGADMFYLGFPLTGTVKLLTLGGCGVWWIVDFIRIGSAPVYAYNFRVAADLPHWLFVLLTLTVVQLVGWGMVYYTVSQHRMRAYKAGLMAQLAREQAGSDLPFYKKMVEAKRAAELSKAKMLGPPQQDYAGHYTGGPLPNPYGSM